MTAAMNSIGKKSQTRIEMAYRLSWLLVIVVVGMSLAAAISPELFRDPAYTVGNARGTALVMLNIAVPALVTAMIYASRGSEKARLVWLGTLAYILYNTFVFTFSLAFNPLFLLYVTALSLSFWAFIDLYRAVNVEKLTLRFDRQMPVKRFAVYMMVVAGLFFVNWMGQIVPGLITGGRPAFLAGTNMLVSPIHVLDLAVALPVCFLAGMWLWTRKPAGYFVTGIMLVMLTIETYSIAIDQLFGFFHDTSYSPAAAPLFGVLTMLGLVVTVSFLSNIDKKPDTRR